LAPFRQRVFQVLQGIIALGVEPHQAELREDNANMGDLGIVGGDGKGLKSALPVSAGFLDLLIARLVINRKGMIADDIDLVGLCGTVRLVVWAVGEKPLLAQLDTAFVDGKIVAPLLIPLLVDLAQLLSDACLVHVQLRTVFTLECRMNQSSLSGQGIGCLLFRDSRFKGVGYRTVNKPVGAGCRW
jgi:hypothetical protein